MASSIQRRLSRVEAHTAPPLGRWLRVCGGLPGMDLARFVLQETGATPGPRDTIIHRIIVGADGQPTDTAPRLSLTGNEVSL